MGVIWLGSCQVVFMFSVGLQLIMFIFRDRVVCVICELIVFSFIMFRVWLCSLWFWKCFLFFFIWWCRFVLLLVCSLVIQFSLLCRCCEVSSRLVIISFLIVLVLVLGVLNIGMFCVLQCVMLMLLMLVLVRVMVFIVGGMLLLLRGWLCSNKVFGLDSLLVILKWLWGKCFRLCRVIWLQV